MERAGYWSQVGRDLRRPRSIALPVVTFGVLAVLTEPGWGVSGALLMSVLVVYDVLGNARERAVERFFGLYAESRGLEQSREEPLPAVTPLLSRGDDRWGERLLGGTLPGGLPGLLALYTYTEERHYDAEGNPQAEAFLFTVAIHEVPGAEWLADLRCEPRAGSHFTDSVRARSRGMRRLELESVAADRRYEIFFDPADDENWLRRVYAPSFIVWLAESAPADFGFEISNGCLCGYLGGHRKDAAQLDALCEAAALVARRFAEKAAAEVR